MDYSGESIEHITAGRGRAAPSERGPPKPGGFLALDTRNAEPTRWTGRPSTRPQDQYRHVEMAAMLRGNGFVIEGAEGINYGGDSAARGVLLSH